MVRFILQFHRLPVAGDPALFYDPNGVTYASTPYFPYIISAGLCAFSKLLHIPLEAYRVSRLVSVFSGTVAVYFVEKTSAKLFPNNFARYFTPVFFAFIPQMAFISSYTNQDSFMVMLSAATIYLWVFGIKNNWDTRTVVFTGIVLGLMLLSYLNGYVLIVSTLFVVLLSYKKRLSPEFARKVLLCVGIMFAVSGWFFIRNAIIYHGDFLGMNTMNAISEKLAKSGLRPSDKLREISQLGGISGLILETTWPALTFRSFWACFGNMDIFLPKEYYLGIIVLSVIAFIGLSARLLEKNETGSHTFKAGLVFTAVLAFVLAVYYSLQSDFQPQGRYMFPGLVPIVFLMVYGFERVFSKNVKIMFYKITGAAFILIDIYAAYRLLLIHYFS